MGMSGVFGRVPCSGDLAMGVRQKGKDAYHVWLCSRVSRETLINIGPKCHALGVGHSVDHGGKLVSTSNCPTMKKARCCGLSCWSECTDLNRGPLVPQVVRKPFSWVGSGQPNGLFIEF